MILCPWLEISFIAKVTTTKTPKDSCWVEFFLIYRRYIGNTHI